MTAPPVSKAVLERCSYETVAGTNPHQSPAFGTVRLRARAPQRPASSSGMVSTIINTQCPIVHVPASRVTLICHPWRPPGEESKCFVSVTKRPGLCWHSPVCRSTAVRDRGFSTTRQPGACAAPSCWMPHCSHCTSSAAGLSQNTLPFVPDTAARKAQGDGSPGDKRYQRELPLHHQELALTQLLSPHSFLSQSLTGTRRERTALTRRCFLNQVPLSRQDTLKPLLALLDLKAKSTSCTLSSFTSSIARKG